MSHERIGGTVVEQLNVFDAEVYTVADSHVARPQSTVAPKIKNNHALQVRNPVRFGILHLIVDIPPRHVREPVQAMR